jgi:hypothetical protein
VVEIALDTDAPARGVDMSVDQVSNLPRELLLHHLDDGLAFLEKVIVHELTHVFLCDLLFCLQNMQFGLEFALERSYLARKLTTFVVVPM